MQKRAVGFLFVGLFLVGFVGAYDVGPLIEQGFNTHFDEEEAESDDIVYQEIIKDYKDAGLTEEDLIEDVEGILDKIEETAEVKTATSGTRTISIERADRETDASNKNTRRALNWKRYEKSFWEKFLDYLKSVFTDITLVTGYVVVDEEFGEIELPDLPNSPGGVEEVLEPTFDNMKIYSFLTGNAILGLPDWVKDGDEQEGVRFSAEYTKTEGENALHHFDIKYIISLGEEQEDYTPYNRGVVYNTGYYLNEKQGNWEEFDFKGTRIRQTDWLLESASGKAENGDFEVKHFPVVASLTLSDYTDNDYSIFLAYSCRKPSNENPWECNDGKWVLFVVETGDVNYHEISPDTPILEYTENADLNLTDLPSLLEQLGLNAYEVQPTLHDLLLVSPEEGYEYGLDEVGDLRFIIKNLGNKKVEDIEYEIDIGEKDLVDVVSASLPKNLEIGEAQLGTISLKFKERGKWNFPVSIVPKAEEVDTSDNFLTFGVTVGAPIIVKEATDPIDQNWSRTINYQIKEPYTEEEFEIGDGLWIKSGTDKVRTVFGDYRGAAPSEFPRIRIDFKPVVSSEAIDRYVFLSAIFIGAEMLAGDKEIVKYYLKISDDETGEVYTTPEMESNYKYYYDWRDLIPNFQFCRSYSAETVITSNPYDSLLFEDPESIYVRNESCSGGGGQKRATFLASVKRLLKVDGNNYLITYGYFSNDIIFEPLGTSFAMELEDSVAGVTYLTPNVQIGDVGVFRLEEVITKQIDFVNGEEFIPDVIFPQRQSVVGEGLLKTEKGRLEISWNDWFVNVNAGPKLILLDKRIIFDKNPPSVGGGKSNDWKSGILVGYDIIHPRYHDNDLIKSINEETRFDFIIEDVTSGEIVYHGKNFKLEDIGKSEENYGRYPPKKEGLLSGKIGFSYVAMTQDYKKNSPEFVHGHFYYMYLRVVSANADMYAPAPISKIYYIDPYQLVVNNPLLRTRFLNMHNAPIGVRSGVETTEYGKDIPKIRISYLPRNLFYNSDTNKIEKLDISQREIKPSQLFSIEPPNGSRKIFEDGLYTRGPGQQIGEIGLERKGLFENKPVDYINDGEYIEPLFTGMNMEIIPLEVVDEEMFRTRTTKNFNCKIGRYDGVCYRGNSGYIFLYVDEVNDVAYRFTLSLAQSTGYELETDVQREVGKRIRTKQKSNFIVQNRQNPSLHDSIVYDILSEIDRNPVNTFELTQTFEREIKRPDRINLLYEPILYEDLGIFDYSFVCDDAENINKDPEGFLGERGDYPLMDFVPIDDKYEEWAMPMWQLNNYIGDKKWDSSDYKKITYNIYDSPKKNVLSMERWSDSSRDELVFVYRGKAKVLNFDNGEVVAQKEFNWKNEKTTLINRVYGGKETQKGLALGNANDEVSKWFYSLNLEPYVRYRIDFEMLETDKPDFVVASFPIVFTHRPDYIDLMVNQNVDYLRKIAELNSTVLSSGTIEVSCSTGGKGTRREGKLDPFDVIPSSLIGINSRPQQNMYDVWQSKEFITKGPFFSATFVVNPDTDKDYEGEYTTEEEFLDNAYGLRRKELISDKAYEFSVYKPNNIYDWFLLAPSNDLNTLDTNLRGVICYSTENLLESTSDVFSGRAFTLYCRWGNIDELTIYKLQINMGFEGKEIRRLRDIPQGTKDEIRAYAETVLSKYLDWYPPSPILETTYQTYY